MDSFVFYPNKGNVKDILREGQAIMENHFLYTLVNYMLRDVSRDS